MTQQPSDPAQLERIAHAIAQGIDPGEVIPMPEIAPPPDTYVRLPGGLTEPGHAETAVYDAQVRELTGMDEEAIERARRSGRPDRWYNALIVAGTEKIGSEDATEALLDRLLVGDRDALGLAIRRATYGDEIEYVGLTCPHCQHTFDLNLTLDDIPIKKLTASSERNFDVTLRRGRTARVTLATGADQNAIFSAEASTDAETQSLLLTRCVISVTDENGVERAVAGNPTVVRALSVADRHTIMRELTKRQPGPRYDEVTFTHDECGKEVPFAVGIGDLFPDL